MVPPPPNKQGRLGGVFRDHKGNWLAGFTANFYCSSSNQDEVWALKYAVDISLSKNIQMLEIQFDSQVLVKGILGDTTTPNLNTMISDCRLLLKALKKFRIRRIFRETNAVPNLLAKHRLPNNTNFTLFYHPLVLVLLLSITICWVLCTTDRSTLVIFLLWKRMM